MYLLIISEMNKYRDLIEDSSEVKTEETQPSSE